MAGKVSTYEDIVARCCKDVTAPSGLTFMIRKVAPTALLGIVEGGLPDIIKLVEESGPDDREKRALELLSSAPGQLNKAMEIIVRVVGMGIKEPSLAPGNPSGMTPADLEYADLLALFHAILDHSGWNKAAAREVLPLSETGG